MYDHFKGKRIQLSKRRAPAYPATAPRHYATDQGMLKARCGRPGNSLRSNSPGRFPPLRLSIPKIGV